MQAKQDMAIDSQNIQFATNDIRACASFIEATLNFTKSTLDGLHSMKMKFAEATSAR